VRVLRLLLQGNWLHWVVFAALLLATILIPFAIWAEHEWKVMNPALVAVTAALLLAADIVLPIVSRVVGATLRKILGAWLGTLTGVAGLTLGCIRSYSIGWTIGNPATREVVGTAVRKF
jgi:membrane protein DedA with SNARE-associated domain